MSSVEHVYEEVSARASSPLLPYLSAFVVLVVSAKTCGLLSAPKQGTAFRFGPGEGQQKVCDGEAVMRLGATSYLARQMLIWSESDVARVGALVVDSCARRWGIKDLVTSCGGVPLAVATIAFLVGVIMANLFVPHSLVAFTTAADVRTACYCLGTSLFYVVGACAVATLIGAEAGLFAVTVVIFHVYWVSLLYGNIALSFPRDHYAGGVNERDDEWEQLLKAVRRRGIGQTVLGISDEGLLAGWRYLSPAKQKEFSPLVASLVRGDKAKLEVLGDVRMENGYGMFHRNWVGVKPPIGLTRENDVIEPVYGGESMDFAFNHAALKRKLVQVGLDTTAGTNSTNPVYGNEGTLPVFYEQEEDCLDEHGVPKLSLLCVQPFRHARCRKQQQAGTGYCRSSGPPPVTLEEAWLLLFAALWGSWSCLGWMEWDGVGGEPPANESALVFCVFNAFLSQRVEYLWAYRATPLLIKRFIAKNTAVVRVIWILLAFFVFTKVEKAALYVVLLVYLAVIVPVRWVERRNWADDECWRWGVEDGKPVGTFPVWAETSDGNEAAQWTESCRGLTVPRALIAPVEN
ncbi:hypothetical protein Esi_0435_0017 [Ectocarpus siliculosus]|uniref:Uncharacterized protein n=1 Tax=Ectocarpus siliculosus TaxID=2880 RepID=D7G158_ECTSI|nr:hypothetical protein Esi_0435_0017 [Ectocarpus siliculosus]|eukprot:CBJ33168.1 hypothetical protein Esi_0435_0017 [Ectocarpus siliculosus]